MAAGVLDVEDAEHRQARLQNAFQKLNSSTSSKPPSNLSFLSAESARSKPQYIPPPTELLSRVQAFLPALEASNALLSSQDPTHIDIEHIDSDSGPYIEMNLGLGLFDVRGPTSAFNTNMTDVPMFPVSQFPSTSSECSTASTLTSSSSSSSSSSDDWDSDESSDVEIIITSFKPVRPVRPLPRRAAAVRRMQTRPSIVMLGESDCGVHSAEGG